MQLVSYASIRNPRSAAASVAVASAAVKAPLGTASLPGAAATLDQDSTLNAAESGPSLEEVSLSSVEGAMEEILESHIGGEFQALEA